MRSNAKWKHFSCASCFVNHLKATLSIWDHSLWDHSLGDHLLSDHSHFLNHLLCCCIVSPFSSPFSLSLSRYKVLVSMSLESTRVLPYVVNLTLESHIFCLILWAWRLEAHMFCLTLRNVARKGNTDRRALTLGRSTHGLLRCGTYFASSWSVGIIGIMHHTQMEHTRVETVILRSVPHVFMYKCVHTYTCTYIFLNTSTQINKCISADWAHTYVHTPFDTSSYICAHLVHAQDESDTCMSVTHLKSTNRYSKDERGLSADLRHKS